MSDNKGHILVDLDGTLAFDIPNGPPFDIRLIGPPVPQMVRIIQEHYWGGEEVLVFTARANTIDHHTIFDGTAEEYLAVVVSTIKKWCLEHLGFELEVTCEKNYRTKIIYDDRARQVEKNKGQLVGCMQCFYES